MQHSELVYDDAIHPVEDAYMYPARPIDLEQDGVAEVVAGSGFSGMRVYRFDSLLNKWTPLAERLTLFGCGDVADARTADLDGDDVPEFVAI